MGVGGRRSSLPPRAPKVRRTRKPQGLTPRNALPFRRTALGAVLQRDIVQIEGGAEHGVGLDDEAEVDGPTREPLQVHRLAPPSPGVCVGVSLKHGELLTFRVGEQNQKAVGGMPQLVGLYPEAVREALVLLDPDLLAEDVPTVVVVAEAGLAFYDEFLPVPGPLRPDRPAIHLTVLDARPILEGTAVLVAGFRRLLVAGLGALARGVGGGIQGAAEVRGPVPAVDRAGLVYARDADNAVPAVEHGLVVGGGFAPGPESLFCGLVPDGDVLAFVGV